MTLKLSENFLHLNAAVCRCTVIHRLTVTLLALANTKSRSATQSIWTEKEEKPSEQQLCGGKQLDDVRGQDRQRSVEQHLVVPAVPRR